MLPSVSWDETHERMIFFWTDAHPNTSLNLRHSKTAQTLPWKLRDTWTGLAAERRYEMSNSSYVAVQSMVKDKAGWYNDEPWEIVLRGNGSFENDRISAKWSFVFICCICFSAWQDIFLAIQAVRLLRTLRINRTRVNLVRLSRETCGNSCQVVRTFVDSGPFCQHSASNSVLGAFDILDLLLSRVEKGLQSCNAW